MLKQFKKLTALQKLFVKEYIRDFDIVRAYTLIKPKDTDPRLNGWLYFSNPNIKECIEYLIKKGAEAVNVTKDRCLIACAEILDGNTAPRVKLEAIKTIALINEWTTDEEDAQGEVNIHIHPPK